MRRPISTKVHAALDYITAGTLMAVPRMLGFSRAMTCAMDTMAVSTVMYTLFTRHEGGIVRKIPMKTHLLLDAASGAGLAALPFMLGEEDETTQAVCAGLGLFEIATAAMTETGSTEAGVAQPIRRSIRKVREAMPETAGSRE